MSHIVDQSVYSELPVPLLQAWSTAHVDKSPASTLAEITLSVVFVLFQELAATYDVQWCEHLICRHCLSRFKAQRLTRFERGLHRWLTFVLFRVKNEGDADLCHRTTPNSKLLPYLKWANPTQTAVALAARGLPLQTNAIGTCNPSSSTKTEVPTPSVPALSSQPGVLRGRTDPGRAHGEWKEGDLHSLEELPRVGGNVGTSSGQSGLSPSLQGVPVPSQESKPSWWIHYNSPQAIQKDIQTNPVPETTANKRSRHRPSSCRPSRSRSRSRSYSRSSSSTISDLSPPSARSRDFD